MPAQDDLLREFLRISGPPQDLDPIARAIAGLSAQVAAAAAQPGQPPIAAGIVGPTPTPAAAAAAQTGGVSGTLQGVLSDVFRFSPIAPGSASSPANSDSIAEKVVKNLFGIAPLASLIAGLFRGSGDPPPALLKFAPPPSIAFNAAQTRDGFTTTDYDQSGAPRAGQPLARPGSPGAPDAGGSGGPQITVNVQAMDSRSFIDNSAAIAGAVRAAMLDNNYLGEVLDER